MVSDETAMRKMDKRIRTTRGVSIDTYERWVGLEVVPRSDSASSSCITSLYGILCRVFKDKIRSQGGIVI